MTNLPDVAFRSDTLKSNFERVFSVAGPNAMGFVREMARVTDWENERVRTGIYCGSYFIAWFFGYTSLVCGLFFAVLMGFPRTRRYLFPQVSLEQEQELRLTSATATLRRASFCH